MSKSLFDFIPNEKVPDKKSRAIESKADFSKFLKEFKFNEDGKVSETKIDEKIIDNVSISRFINEYWTSKQRQASSIHEVSYRACFKPQLPRFFISQLTKEGEVVYDPFSGRGTTVLEAGRMGRNIVQNDINPLSKILIYPRFFVPKINEVKERLDQITYSEIYDDTMDLSMFYHEETMKEILSIKDYMINREKDGEIDTLDYWIKMVATNRLTGHSPGFFSVFTLPPNQAASQKSQIKINEKRNQVPPYRNTKKIILTKTKSLIKDVTISDKKNLKLAGENGQFLTNDARKTSEIKDESVSLTVTSPPFLDIVQYAKDNWLRCWFNNIDINIIEKKITMAKNISAWSNTMNSVYSELYRITKPGGWIAFEVGEVRKGKYKLDEYIVPIGIENNFECVGILINDQEFTKTANIWGINNNESGTNTNRIVIFHK